MTPAWPRITLAALAFAAVLWISARIVVAAVTGSP